MSQQRPWRAVDPDLFRFTTTELRDLNIGLMSAFDQAAIVAPALNLDQVRAALRTVGWEEWVDDASLQRALAALVGWGLLDATQDHGAVYSTPEEFERKNLQWSLTPRGEAGISGLLNALDSLKHAVGLQPAVLDAIGDGLGDLADLLEQPYTDALDARIHLRLAEVEGHHSSLLVSVRQFNAHLQRLLREEAADESVFTDVKVNTISYLKEYVDGVEGPQQRLAVAIERLAEAGVATLFDRALRGANLAPVAGGDPAPAWIERRQQRWEALRSWFAPTDAGVPRIEGLLDIARSAIIELLRVLERRWDNKRRSVSVANDFRRLANRLAVGWGGFTGTAEGLDPPRPEGVPDDYVMQPFLIRLAYTERHWLTVRFELGHDEIGSTDRREFHIAPDIVKLFATLGLDEPDPIPLLAVDPRSPRSSTPARRSTRRAAATTVPTTWSTCRSSLKTNPSTCP